MNRIYKEVATIYNTTPDEVEREIKFAIMAARNNPTPAARAFWGRVADSADVAEVIGNIVSRVALVV